MSLNNNIQLKIIMDGIGEPCFLELKSDTTLEDISDYLKEEFQHLYELLINQNDTNCLSLQSNLKQIGLKNSTLYAKKIYLELDIFTKQIKYTRVVSLGQSVDEILNNLMKEEKIYFEYNDDSQIFTISKMFGKRPIHGKKSPLFKEGITQKFVLKFNNIETVNLQDLQPLLKLQDVQPPVKLYDVQPPMKFVDQKLMPNLNLTSQQDQQKITSQQKATQQSPNIKSPNQQNQQTLKCQDKYIEQSPVITQTKSNHPIKMVSQFNLNLIDSTQNTDFYQPSPLQNINKKLEANQFEYKGQVVTILEDGIQNHHLVLYTNESRFLEVTLYSKLSKPKDWVIPSDEIDKLTGIFKYEGVLIAFREKGDGMYIYWKKRDDQQKRSATKFQDDSDQN